MAEDPHNYQRWENIYQPFSISARINPYQPIIPKKVYLKPINQIQPMYPYPPKNPPPQRAPHDLSKGRGSPGWPFVSAWQRGTASTQGADRADRVARRWRVLAEHFGEEKKGWNLMVNQWISMLNVKLIIRLPVFDGYIRGIAHGYWHTHFFRLF